MSEQSERDSYSGVQMEIVDYCMYVKEALASVHMSFEAQASVCMSFEAWTSLRMSLKLRHEQK